MTCEIEDVLDGMRKPSSWELEDMLDKIGEAMVKNLPYVPASKAGLDTRAGRLYIGRDFVACVSGNDRTLQYYGGFEYIDKDYRRECGSYVFYYAEAGLVRDAIDAYEASNKEAGDED